MAITATFNHLPGLTLLAFHCIMGNSEVVLDNQRLSLRCCHLIFQLPGLKEPLRPVVGKLKTLKRTRDTYWLLYLAGLVMAHDSNDNSSISLDIIQKSAV